MNIRNLVLIGACSLAIAVPAIAQAPVEADDTEESAQQWNPEGPLHDPDEDAVESDPADDLDGDVGGVLSDVSTMDDAAPSASDAAPAEPELSLKREVKRTVFGALLPAIERRVRNAVDKDI